MALLPSRRHRPEDLACWRTLELADRAHYRPARVEEKAERAMSILADYLRDGPAYLATSFGKDSTVVTHLLWRLSRTDPYALLCPVYRVVMTGIEPEGTDQVESEFLHRFPLPRYQRILVEHDPAWLREEGKRERALGIGIARCQELAGTARYINGLRADESSARRVRMRHLGLASASSCSPCGWWSTQDVFSYLVHHDLPVHPHYAMLGGGFWDRNQLRVCMLGNHKGRQFGRLLWERWYYGDVLDAMRDRHPNMVPPG